ncbi:MAG: class I SAM-dependent methyltransferase [Cyanobacteria bacterium J06639_14]
MKNLEIPQQNNFLVRMPKSSEIRSQEDEYFTVISGDKEQVLKLHDYAKIYKIPGLYKHVLIDILDDQSPATLSSLLLDQVSQAGGSMADLKVLDIGAGIGVSGRSLIENGVGCVIGLDILSEAREASCRDLPDTYLDYYVADLLELPEETRLALKSYQFNCLTCCSALTWHLPAKAFVEAFNLIADNSWIAFNVGQLKLDPEYSSNDDFYQFLQSAIANKIFQVNNIHHYQHRLSMNKQPIYYCAVVGRKKGDFLWPEDCHKINQKL